MISLSSKEILDKVSDTAAPKATMSTAKLLLLGILAGAYIAFGAEGSTMASFNLLANPETVGLGRFVMGAIFPCGLMLVILCGAELFTGNCLMICGVLDKKAKVTGMLRNWAIVYIGNFIGSLMMVFFMSQTGLWATGGGMLGAMVVKIAAGKCGLSFGSAFVCGILCNWLVCLAVWIATGAGDTASKILGIWWCIMFFVMSGFEHSIANMYFIPAGIVASHNAEFVNLLGTDITNLNVQGFLLNNLLPVTLGNIVGGMVFAGMVYWFAHRRLK
ncbi:MAG: formate/nitrite transporter family protein [Eubacterium sp.]|nr:formate/nitrite transporter family protein [Candidatus Colimonas fimequi]